MNAWIGLIYCNLRCTVICLNIQLGFIQSQNYYIFPPGQFRFPREWNYNCQCSEIQRTLRMGWGPCPTVHILTEYPCSIALPLSDKLTSAQSSSRVVEGQFGRESEKVVYYTDFQLCLYYRFPFPPKSLPKVMVLPICESFGNSELFIRLPLGFCHFGLRISFSPVF